MALAPQDVLVFDRGDLDPVVVLMEWLSETHDGWLVIDPGVEVHEVPVRSGLAGLFSAAGPGVPRCSWVPGEVHRGRAAPLSVGIQHGRGRRARPVLAEKGIAVPAGWSVVGDHPKRGLVLRVPDDADHHTVLAWLLGAAAALSTVPTDDDWQASVYRRR